VFEQERVKYLKLSDSFSQATDGFTVVEISNCIGNQSTHFLTDPEDLGSQVDSL
jgi:hypothetical protein